MEFDTAPAPHEVPELIENADTPADGRRDRGSGHAHFRKRADSKYQAGVQNDIYAVCQPQRTQCNSGIARASKRSVQQKKINDAHRAAKNHCSEADTLLNDAIGRAHHLKKISRIHDPRDPDDNR